MTGGPWTYQGGHDFAPSTIDRDLITWPAAYARLALVEGGSGAPAPSLGRYGARVGPMIYVAARSPDRLGPSVVGPGRGLSVLVVPIAGLVNGRPRELRGSMLSMFDVCGCRGFLLGVRRELDRTPPAGDPEMSAA